MARLTTQGLSGHQIGKWSVFESFPHPTRRERLYRCVCACGTEKTVKHTHLADGKTSSCGCSWTTHGMSRSNEYRVWDSMIRRCHSPAHHAFKDYGARGILVCAEWRTFEGYYADMGAQPEGMTLERIDNAQGYSKDNCTWATITEQARNRRTTKLDANKVASIKRLLIDKVSQQKIADMFLVTRSNIAHIAQNSTWREVCPS